MKAVVEITNIGRCLNLIKLRPTKCVRMALLLGYTPLRLLHVDQQLAESRGAKEMVYSANWVMVVALMSFYEMDGVVFHLMNTRIFT
jgi:hypothetical protein